MLKHAGKKILSCKSTCGSAMDLRDIIEEMTGQHFLVSKQASCIEQEGCLIRYGNGFPIHSGCPDTEFNPASFCSLSANKLRFSRFALDNGIYSPVFSTDEDGIPQVFPVLIRETLSGCGGEGIHKITNREEFDKTWKPGWWWTPYVETDWECRLYVAGEVTHAYYKVPFDFQKDETIKVRSDYHFSWTDHTGKFNTLKEIVRFIQKRTGGKFFSIDAGWVKSIQRYVVFEINTGSWINHSIGVPLAEYLIKELGIEKVN